MIERSRRATRTKVIRTARRRFVGLAVMLAFGVAGIDVAQAATLTTIGTTSNASDPSVWQRKFFGVTSFIPDVGSATISFGLRNDVPPIPGPDDDPNQSRFKSELTRTRVSVADTGDQFLIHFDYAGGPDTSHWRDVRLILDGQVFRDQFGAFNNHLGNAILGTARQGAGNHSNILGESGFDAGTYVIDFGFRWGGACGTTDWHGTCAGGLSNWNRASGGPAGTSPGDIARTSAIIAGADVVISDRAVDLKSLNAAGSLTVNAPVTLAQNSSIQNLTLNSDLTPNGGLTLTGDDVNLKGGRLTAVAGTSIALDASGVAGTVIDGGTVLANGVVRNGGNATFKSGIIDGAATDPDSATGIFVNPGGSTLFISPDGARRELRGVLQNSGSVLHRPDTALNIEGGILVNRTGGQYQMFNGSRVATGTDGRFRNDGGSLVVANGRADLELPFDNLNGGSVVVDPGARLFLRRGGDHRGAGTFDVGEEADMVMSGTHVFDGDQTLRGKGLVNATAGSEIRIDGGRVTNRMDEGGRTVVFGQLTATGGTFVNEGDLELAGSAQLTGGAVTETGSDNGLRNHGLLTVRGIGPQIADGVLRNSVGGVVRQLSDLRLDGGTILNDSGGVYDLNGRNLTGADGSLNAFDNRGGTFRGSGTVTAPFNLLSGRVQVDAGDLVFAGGGNSSGTGQYNVAAGATLSLTNGTHRFGGDYTVSGEGIFFVRDGGTLESRDRFTTNLTGPGKAVFDSQAGGFSVAGAILVNQGNAEWRSGGFGEFLNDGGMFTITDGAAKAMRTNFENTGTVEHNADANLFMTERAHLTNSGTYNLRGQLLAESTAQKITNELAGTFRLAEQGATRAFAGTFDNKGTVEVGRGSRLELTGDVVSLSSELGLGDVLRGQWIADGGAIQFGDGTARIDTNLGSITLTRGGTLSVLPLSSDLNGRDFANGGSFTLRDDKTFRTAADFVNDGILRVLDTSELVVNGQFETNAGSRNRIDGSLTTTDLDVDGGRFGGSGTINAQRFNAKGGLIGPGNSPGIMEVAGDYNHFAPAVLEIEIGGLIAGLDYDRLVVGGDANLSGGTLQVLLLDDFSPLLDQTFDILTAETITGAFDLFDVPTVDGDPLFDLTVVNLFETGRQALRLTALATGLPDKEPPGGGSNDVPEPGFLVLLLAASLGLMALRPPGAPPSGYATRTEGYRRGGSTRPRPACRSGRAGSSGSACRSCG